jgi:hypothetical protein
MFGEVNGAVSRERLLGGELVRAAETLLAGTKPDPRDPAQTARLATVQSLLAVYWELRHRGAAPATDEKARPGWLSLDPSLEALLASSLSPGQRRAAS